jgi:hypothetical protein
MCASVCATHSAQHKAPPPKKNFHTHPHTHIQHKQMHTVRQHTNPAKHFCTPPPSRPSAPPHRLGVDDADSYAQLVEFVQTVSERGGVTDFVIHARKCLLNGISPAQNRSVPPLRHDWVWALKRDFPHLSFQV